MLHFDEIEPNIQRATQLMEMLAHPVRLQILCALSENECCVGALTQAVKLTQPAVSHHLKKLREARLIKSRRDGQTIYHQLEGEEVNRLMDLLRELYCQPHRKNTGNGAV